MTDDHQQQTHQNADEMTLIFSAEAETVATDVSPWTILIVDDEPEIHQVTLMALRDFNFQGARLHFISAYSATEAKKRLENEPNIALVLLDVVMETDDAGLTLVHYIRNTLQNSLVRIVLRTGQPGQAPEQRIMHDYDINDYRAKTELTVQRLATTVLAALRSYTALLQLAQSNDTLEAKVKARTAELEASNLQLQQSLAELEAGERAGKQVQFAMLPPPVLQCGAFHFSHVLYSAEYMSGDFVDYFYADERHVVFYIADVAGHGVASAFVTVYLKRFISTCLDRYQRGSSDLLLTPAALLTSLNQELLQESFNKYIAMFYAVLDTNTGLVHYANAGAFPWPLHLSATQAEYIPLKSTPVGMFDFAQYKTQTLTLAAQDTLLLCSDGLLELLPGESSEQKLQGLQAYCRTLLLADHTADMAGLLASLAIDPALGIPDDLTILMLKRIN